MAGRYKQMLIDEETHAELREAKELMFELSGRKLSSREVMAEFLGRRLRFLRLRKGIRSYIDAFVSDASLNGSIMGVLLFGSVARGSYTKESDIDLLVVADRQALSLFGDVHRMVDRAEELRADLVKENLHMRITPVLLSAEELRHFRPIYIDFLEDGVILFERGEMLSMFLNDIRKSVDYEKVIVNNKVMIRWKIRK